MHFLYNLTGRVGKDAETKFLSSGTQVTNFSVAEDRSYGKKKDDGTWENVEVTIWWEVSVFGGKAAWANNIKKGYLFVGNGDVTVNAYINNNGEAAGSLRLKAVDFQFFQTVKVDYKKAEEEDVEF